MEKLIEKMIKKIIQKLPNCCQRVSKAQCKTGQIPDCTGFLSASFYVSEWPCSWNSSCDDHNEGPQEGTHRPCRLRVLEHQPSICRLLASLGNLYVVDPVWNVVDRWQSQLWEQVSTLPLPCEVCILSKMSQSRRRVFLAWSPCVPAAGYHLKSDLRICVKAILVHQPKTPDKVLYKRESNPEPSLYQCYMAWYRGRIAQMYYIVLFCIVLYCITPQYSTLYRDCIIPRYSAGIMQ